MKYTGLLQLVLQAGLLFPLAAVAADVEVTLKDNLDGDLNGYCLDIKGGGQNIDPSRGLQAHTCYSYRGDLGSDQAFDPEGIARGEFKIVAFDVCATMESTEAGTEVALSACDGSDMQQFDVAENGYISPKSAPGMCLTAGKETTFGRGGTSPHQIKTLTLQSCGDDLTAYQEWYTRTQDEYNSEQSDDQKSIVITGASTGIGRHLAETLAGNGYHVYAGARKDADLEALDAIENVTAVKLDVTNQDQVDAVVAMIREKGTGLYALVNNAGVGGGGEVIDTPIEDQTFVYAVNVEGVYRTTQAFAPLVIESKGRIVTTGSIAGTISAFPGFSAYSGSKHWIEAYTDSLAAEMDPLGVEVSVVEPGNYKSNIRRTSVSREHEQAQAAGGEVTEEMKKDYEATAERELSYKEPDEVSEAFMHALFDDNPLRRYVVVPNVEEQEFTIRTKVVELVQLNEWGPYSYTRDELIELLDAALAGDAPSE